MDFTLTEEQTLLQDSVGRMLEREYDFARRRDIAQAGGFDAAAWTGFAEMGLMGAHFSESAGGFGGNVESMIVMELFGRHLVVEPMLDCVVVPGALLTQGDAGGALLEAVIAGTARPALAVLERGMRSPYAFDEIAAAARPDGSGWRLSGAKSLVPGGGCATGFLIAAKVTGKAGTAVFEVPADAPGLTVTAFRTMDGATAAALKFDDMTVPAESLICPPQSGEAALVHAFDRGCAAICTEAVGSMTHLLEATTAYTKEREQYGAPLASFQALQHRMAEMFVATETARTMAGLAATVAGSAAPSDVALLAAARVRVGRSARFVGTQAVQLHGGMGMSEELDIAHHFTRLTQIRQAFGGESFHLRRFAAARSQDNRASAA